MPATISAAPRRPRSERPYSVVASCWATAERVPPWRASPGGDTDRRGVPFHSECCADRQHKVAGALVAVGTVDQLILTRSQIQLQLGIGASGAVIILLFQPLSLQTQHCVKVR